MRKEQVFPNTFTGNRPKVSLEKKVLCRYGEEIGQISITPNGQELLEHILEQANNLPHNSFESNTYAEISLLNKNEIIRETSDAMAAFMSVKKHLIEAGVCPSMLEVLVKKAVNLGSLIGTYNETTDYLEPTSKLNIDAFNKSKGAKKTYETKNRERAIIEKMVESVHNYYIDKMPKKACLADLILKRLNEATTKRFAKSTIETVIKNYCKKHKIPLTRRAECDYPAQNEVYLLLSDNFTNKVIIETLR
ncbi:hypothetical protein K6U49_04535 [Vibrio alginolyticus]|uniref:hypothetical protein n=1 Tax=Vibrio alginolyticus TaxID=663 RepID=UPI001EEB707D|nr:hypothetical protein [Vibrio alginolyticus]MCG6307887.1 hypothetical protein [Vibrio alginolyticus]